MFNFLHRSKTRSPPRSSSPGRSSTSSGSRPRSPSAYRNAKSPAPPKKHGRVPSAQTINSFLQRRPITASLSTSSLHAGSRAHSRSHSTKQITASTSDPKLELKWTPRHPKNRTTTDNIDFAAIEREIATVYEEINALTQLEQQKLAWVQSVENSMREEEKQLRAHRRMIRSASNAALSPPTKQLPHSTTSGHIPHMMLNKHQKSGSNLSLPSITSWSDISTDDKEDDGDSGSGGRGRHRVESVMEEPSRLSSSSSNQSGGDDSAQEPAPAPAPAAVLPERIPIKIKVPAHQELKTNAAAAKAKSPSPAAKAKSPSPTAKTTPVVLPPKPSAVAPPALPPAPPAQASAAAPVPPARPAVPAPVPTEKPAAAAPAPAAAVSSPAAPPMALAEPPTVMMGALLALSAAPAAAPEPEPKPTPVPAPAPVAESAEPVQSGEPAVVVVPAPAKAPTAPVESTAAENSDYSPAAQMSPASSFHPAKSGDLQYVDVDAVGEADSPQAGAGAAETDGTVVVLHQPGEESETEPVAHNSPSFSPVAAKDPAPASPLSAPAVVDTLQAPATTNGNSISDSASPVAYLSPTGMRSDSSVLSPYNESDDDTVVDDDDDILFISDDEYDRRPSFASYAEVPSLADKITPNRRRYHPPAVYIPPLNFNQDDKAAAEARAQQAQQQQQQAAIAAAAAMLAFPLPSMGLSSNPTEKRAMEDDKKKKDKGYRQLEEEKNAARAVIDPEFQVDFSHYPFPAQERWDDLVKRGTRIGKSGSHNKHVLDMSRLLGDLEKDEDGRECRLALAMQMVKERIVQFTQAARQRLGSAKKSRRWALFNHLEEGMSAWKDARIARDREIKAACDDMLRNPEAFLKTHRVAFQELDEDQVRRLYICNLPDKLDPSAPNILEVLSKADISIQFAVTNIVYKLNLKDSSKTKKDRIFLLSPQIGDHSFKDAVQIAFMPYLRDHALHYELQSRHNFFVAGPLLNSSLYIYTQSNHEPMFVHLTFQPEVFRFSRHESAIMQLPQFAGYKKAQAIERGTYTSGSFVFGTRVGITCNWKFFLAQWDNKNKNVSIIDLYIRD